MDTSSRVRIFVVGRTTSVGDGPGGLGPDLTGGDLAATVGRPCDVAGVDVVPTLPRYSAEFDVDETTALAGGVATRFGDSVGAGTDQGTSTFDELAFPAGRGGRTPRGVDRAGGTDPLTHSPVRTAAGVPGWERSS